MTAKNINIYRIEQLESNHRELDGKMDKLLNNHLPHLERQMIQLSTKLNIMTAINVGAILIAMMVTRIFP